MRSPVNTIIQSAGIILCALGSYILLGWLVGSETMLRVPPGSPAMAINTATLFLVAGVCLLCSRSQTDPSKRLYRSLPYVLVCLPAAILSQHVFSIDLGIDWPTAHASIGDGHAKPGRTAPNACLGFIFAGITFMLTRSMGNHRVMSPITSILAGLTLAIGATAFLGYLFDLEILYQFAAYNKMAALTALGMSALGAGLWSLKAQHAPARYAASLPEERNVSGLAATLMIVFAVATGLAAFGLLKNSYERSAKNSLLQTARTSAISISALLEKTTLLSKSIATRPILRTSLLALSKNPNDTATLSRLRQEIKSMSNLGFSGVQIFDANNMPLASAGTLVANNALMAAPLGPTKEHGVLLWASGYVYKSEYNIHENGQHLGKISLERRLASFNEFMEHAQEIAQSSDLILCSRVQDEAHCFPSRFYDKDFHLPIYKPDGSNVWPIARALLGESGAIVLKDLRGVLVMAAYVPIPEYRLALVEKVDASEQYLPLREKLPYLLAAVIAFVLIGTFLLRKWVNPIVAAILAERQRMKAILNNCNDAFVGVDSSGKITDWNAQAERLLGWHSDQALGHTFDELYQSAPVTGSTQHGFEQISDLVNLAEPDRRVEVMISSRSGEAIPFEVSVAPYLQEQKQAAGLFLRDLRQQKESQMQLAEVSAALAHSQKLDAVGKLTGGVAHDFNNVLQVINGSLQMLSLENPDSFKIQKRVTTAVSAVERGAKLSSQLLAFARKQPLKPLATQLGRVVRDLNELLQRALGSGVQIETIVAAGLWNTLVDPHQLEHVILNLAINARDAMHGEGKLTIEVGNAVLEDDYVRSEPGLKAGQYVMLAVSDTGCGMSPEIVDRAFEPFFTTKPEGSGTGLGLSMAYGFAKQSDGHIKIYSEVGHGTTIKLYLPRSFENEDHPAPSSTSEIVGGRERIFVVEDDLAVQGTAVEILSGLGYTVHKADNAAMALELVTNGLQVDLLFTDVVMPGALRSPELVRQAKEILPDLKVLYTSGYTQNAIVHGGRLDPGVHLLTKPYSREQLARKIRELLSNEANE